MMIIINMIIIPPDLKFAIKLIRDGVIRD